MLHRIAWAREAQGLSIHDLANAASVQTIDVMRLEAGQWGDVTADVAMRVAHALHLVDSILVSHTSLITTAEAAELLGVHPNTLANWRSAGRGPTSAWAGDEGYVYSYREVADYAAQRGLAKLAEREA